MQDDSHDRAWTDAPADPAFENERCWEVDGTMRRGQPAAFNQQPADHPDAPIAEPRFLIDWVDLHWTSEQPADPAYPHGTAIDVALDSMKACRLELPYPAARCGQWIITCRECRFYIALKTTGRADDPLSVLMPCRLH